MVKSKEVETTENKATQMNLDLVTKDLTSNDKD